MTVFAKSLDRKLVEHSVRLHLPKRQVLERKRSTLAASSCLVWIPQPLIQGGSSAGWLVGWLVGDGSCLNCQGELT